MAIIIFLWYFTLSDPLRGYFTWDGFHTYAQCEYVRNQVSMQQPEYKKFSKCEMTPPTGRVGV